MNIMHNRGKFAEFADFFGIVCTESKMGRALFNFLLFFKPKTKRKDAEINWALCITLTECLSRIKTVPLFQLNGGLYVRSIPFK